jgi:teichuronic acid exporter
MIQIISTIIIARLITPEEFGEVAIISVFIHIASLLTTAGFAEALIFRVNNTNSLYSSVFYFNLLISLILYVAIFLFSDQIAFFYEISRLEILSKVVGVNILLFPLTYIHRVLYMLDNNFKTPAFIAFISSLFGSIIGVALALYNFGVWALVWQTLLINLITLILYWKLSRWKPDFVFSFKELKTIMPYSLKIFYNNMVQVLYDNIYTLVIGKIYSAKILGYYNRMQTIVYFTTTNFLFAIESVFFPLLCKKKDDIVHIKNSYELLFRVITFVAFPILIILISLGEPIILLLLTKKWIGSLQILQLLSISFLFLPVTYLNNSFLKIIDKASVLFYSGLIKKIIGVIILYITINLSFEYVLYGIILYSIIDAVISMCITNYLLKINIIKQVYFLLNNIILNILLFLILTYVSSFFDNIFLKVTLSIIAGLFTYVLLAFLLRLKEYQIIKSLIIRAKMKS